MAYFNRSDDPSIPGPPLIWGYTTQNGVNTTTTPSYEPRRPISTKIPDFTSLEGPLEGLLDPLNQHHYVTILKIDLLSSYEGVIVI